MGQSTPGKSDTYWLVYMMDDQCYRLREEEAAVLLEVVKRQGKGLVIFDSCVISISSISSMERKVDRPRIDAGFAPLLPPLTEKQKREEAEGKEKVKKALEKLKGANGRT